MDLRRMACLVVLDSLVVMAGASPARAAVSTYIRLQGAKRGQFNVQVRAKNKWMRVLAFNYSAQSPRDAATGKPPPSARGNRSLS
jgi:hypothetical protein